MRAGRTLRTPRAAGVAGVLFAVLLAVTLVLLRLTAASRLDDAGALLSAGHIEVALGVVPFAGVAFLWLIGVVRDRVGDREDRFLATVSMGSGLLFVAMLFAAGGVAAGSLSAAASATPNTPTQAWMVGRRIAAVLLNTYAMRMAAMFMFSTSTIGLRTGFVPRWLAFCGFAIGLVLLLGIKLTLWVQLLFPLWVLVLSVDILVETFRERPGQEQAEAHRGEWDEQRKSA